MDISYPQATTITGGVARGRSLGGTLTLLTSSIGTDTSWPADGGILLIEDVDEEEYRLDAHSASPLGLPRRRRRNVRRLRRAGTSPGNPHRTRLRALDSASSCEFRCLMWPRVAPRLTALALGLALDFLRKASF
jgi:hypothetical protein